MNFLNAHNKGNFIKGICNYMFYDKEPKFEDKETQMYFDFCKRQLDISKQRKEIGSKRGKQSKVKKIITKEPTPVKMDYIGFKKSHPQITGMLYGSVQNYIKTLDWNRLSQLMERDSELNNKKDIYQLVKLYLNKYEGKKM